MYLFGKLINNSTRKGQSINIVCDHSFLLTCTWCIITGFNKQAIYTFPIYQFKRMINDFYVKWNIRNYNICYNVLYTLKQQLYTILFVPSYFLDCQITTQPVNITFVMKHWYLSIATILSGYRDLDLPMTYFTKPNKLGF